MTAPRMLPPRAPARDTTRPRVSLVLPCRNEARHMAACLDSLLETTFPLDQLELLIVDGQSDDATREVVARYAARHPWIRLLDNPRRIVPTALNIGIRAARAPVIMRLDAHAFYPPEYIARLLDALEASGADNVGGCVRTLPANGSIRARAIAAALSHPFGVGNSYFRIGGGSRPRWVETVPFGCWRRSLFDRVGLFDEELVRNQDDEFNYRLLKAGGRILLLPDLVTRYMARGSHRQLARMLYQYGLFKPLVVQKVGRVVTARQLAPPALVVALAAGALAALVWRPAALLWGSVLAVYAGTALVGALASIRTLGLGGALALAATFPFLHVPYGFGFLRGLWRAVARRPWQNPATVPLTR